jgi:DNA-binding LytR/AlgR family response regulator
VDHSARLVALIVEDEEPVLDEVRECVRSDGRIGKVLTANNALDALKIVADQPMIDIAFLDIKMPGLDGIELSKLISNTPDPPRIVFVTAHSGHVGDAFDLNAADFVLKPMRAERVSARQSRAPLRNGTSTVRDRRCFENFRKLALHNEQPSKRRRNGAQSAFS